MQTTQDTLSAVALGTLILLCTAVLIEPRIRKAAEKRRKNHAKCNANTKNEEKEDKK